MSKPKTIYCVETLYINYIANSDSVIDKKTFESQEDAKIYADKQIEKCKAEAKEEFTEHFNFHRFVNGGGYLMEENGDHEYSVVIEKTELVPDSKKKPPKHIYTFERADNLPTKFERQSSIVAEAGCYTNKDGSTTIFLNSDENKFRPWTKEKYGKSKAVVDTRGNLHRIYTNPAMLIQ